jgi:hypothetical protein
MKRCRPSFLIVMQLTLYRTKMLGGFPGIDEKICARLQQNNSAVDGNPVLSAERGFSAEHHLVENIPEGETGQKKG